MSMHEAWIYSSNATEVYIVVLYERLKNSTTTHTLIPALINRQCLVFEASGTA